MAVYKRSDLLYKIVLLICIHTCILSYFQPYLFFPLISFYSESERKSFCIQILIIVLNFFILDYLAVKFLWNIINQNFDHNSDHNCILPVLFVLYFLFSTFMCIQSTDVQKSTNMHSFVYSSMHVWSVKCTFPTPLFTLMMCLIGVTS